MRQNAPIELSSRMSIVTNAIAHNMMAADNNRQQGKTKKKRGPNWTSKEDEILTKAWSKGTHNSLKGNYQKEGPYTGMILQSIIMVLYPSKVCPSVLLIRCRIACAQLTRYACSLTEYSLKLLARLNQAGMKKSTLSAPLLST